MALNKTVFFLGASTGVGLAALKHTLAAGHKCIALCRTPSKLTDIIPLTSNPNLQVIQGNAHDAAVLSKYLKKDNGTLVDGIVSTIGSKPVISKLSIEDPTVCGKGMTILLEVLAQLRRDGATGKPWIVVCSTTGMSRFGRDYPLVTYPIYQIMLKAPHEDKRVMEDGLAGSGENFTIVRCSLLTNGESNKEIRVGVEDPKSGRESTAIGYTISREDAGNWIAENILLKGDEKYLKKIASITY